MKPIVKEPGGMLVLDPEHMAAIFAGDLPADESAALVEEMRSVSPQIFIEKMGPPGWRQHASWFAVSEDDRMINPGAERFMATRAKAPRSRSSRVTHSPLSHPQQVAGLILTACTKSP